MGAGINSTWRAWLVPPWDRCLWLQRPAAHCPAMPKPLQAAGRVTPDTHPSGEASWVWEMAASRDCLLKWPAVRGWRGTADVNTRGEGRHITFLAKGQVAQQLPSPTHCPACFWVSGYFWPCWQPSLFLRWLWVAMLTLTFRSNWPSSLKDTEQNKGNLRYKYTEIGHTHLSGEPFISSVTVLPGFNETVGSPWCLSQAHGQEQPSSCTWRWSSPGPIAGTGPLYWLLLAEEHSPCLPHLLSSSLIPDGSPCGLLGRAVHSTVSSVEAIITNIPIWGASAHDKHPCSGKRLDIVRLNLVDTQVGLYYYLWVLTSSGKSLFETTKVSK